MSIHHRHATWGILIGIASALFACGTESPVIDHPTTLRDVSTTQLQLAKPIPLEISGAAVMPQTPLQVHPVKCCHKRIAGRVVPHTGCDCK